MKKTFAVLLPICILLAACSQPSEDNSDNRESDFTDQPSWQEQYDVGMRYLVEGSYMEAIVAFTAAIQIDPKQAAPYNGRAESYKLAAEQADDTTIAVDFYEKAIADYEIAASLGDAAASSKAEELRDTIERISFTSEFNQRLEPLFEAFRQNDIDGAKTMMRESEYQEISTLAEDAPIVYDGGDGYVLVVYQDNFYYYGQWDNNQRNGEGLWCKAVFDSDVDIYTYQGYWSNDLPNGNGTIVRQRDANKVQVEPGHTTSIRTEIVGEFKNGLFDGTINEVWHMNDGGTHVWTPITAVSGIYQPMLNIPSSITSRDYYKEQVAQGKYVVAIDTNNESTDLWNSGSVCSVLGILTE